MTGVRGLVNRLTVKRRIGRLVIFNRFYFLRLRNLSRRYEVVSLCRVEHHSWWVGVPGRCGRDEGQLPLSIWIRGEGLLIVAKVTWAVGPGWPTFPLAIMVMLVSSTVANLTNTCKLWEFDVENIRVDAASSSYTSRSRHLG